MPFPPEKILNANKGDVQRWIQGGLGVGVLRIGFPHRCGAKSARAWSAQNFPTPNFQLHVLALNIRGGARPIKVSR